MYGENKGIEGTFNNLFFNFPDTNCAESMFQSNPDTNLLLEDIFTKAINEYIHSNKGKISEDISEKFVDLAKNYSELNIEKREQCRKDPEVGVPYSKLLALIKHPGFIADERSIEVFEELVNTNNPGPWQHEMYTDFKKKDEDSQTSDYFIREGFGLPQIEGFDRLVYSDLWYGKNKDIKVLFAAVSQALGKLAEQYPKETLNSRIMLMEKSFASKMDTGPIQKGYVYSFRTDWEKDELRKTAEEAQENSKLQKRCLEILEGKFNENTKWF